MRKYYLTIILISFLPAVFSSCVQTPMDFSNENETLIYSRDRLYSQGYCQNIHTIINDSTITKVRLSFTLETDCIDSSNNVSAYFMLFADTNYFVGKHGVECNLTFNQTYSLYTKNNPLNFSMGMCSCVYFHIKAENIKLFKVSN